MTCKHEGCNGIPKGKRKQCHQCSTLRHKYGINTPERDALLESQDGQCMICSANITFDGQCSGIRKHSACVDHCHSSGAVRGILCGMCNAGIGMFFDRPDFMRAAADYLEEA